MLSNKLKITDVAMKLSEEEIARTSFSFARELVHFSRICWGSLFD